MIRFDRLAELETHLRYGQLGHASFSFARVVQLTPCGTAGCALGELPFIWPKDWRFEGRASESGYTGWPRMDLHDLFSGALDWFGIGMEEYDHLFLPGKQNPKYGGEYLSCSATAEEVAGNIRAFREKMGDPNLQHLGGPSVPNPATESTPATTPAPALAATQKEPKR